VRSLGFALGAAFALTACGSVERDAAGNPPPGACDANPTPTPVVSSARESQLVTNDQFTIGITADAHGAYWTQGANLRMLAQIGSEPRTLFQGTNGSVVAVDADAIYFHGSVTLSYEFALLRLDRGATEPRVLASIASETPWGVQGPVLDAERAYFMNDSGRIASVPKVGGPKVDTVIDAGYLHDFTVDDTHLYWLEGKFDVSSLKRVAKAGGEPETLAAGFKKARLPRVVGDSVLFTAEHGLFAVPKTGGCARALVWDTTHHVVAFLADSDHVYFKRVVDSDTGYSSVLRVPFAGGDAVELTTENTASAAPGLGLSGNLLYWTSDRAVHALEL
jgi:hypothetical protein